MVAAATGLAARGYKPFASTFAAFLTRARDFIRMGAISGVDLRTDPTQRVTRSADCLRTCALPWGTAATGCWVVGAIVKKHAENIGELIGLRRRERPPQRLTESDR
jgi:hypothetical protein